MKKKPTFLVYCASYQGGFGAETREELAATLQEAHGSTVWWLHSDFSSRLALQTSSARNLLLVHYGDLSARWPISNDQRVTVSQQKMKVELNGKRGVERLTVPCKIGLYVQDTVDLLPGRLGSYRVGIQNCLGKPASVIVGLLEEIDTIAKAALTSLVTAQVTAP